MRGCDVMECGFTLVILGIALLTLRKMIGHAVCRYITPGVKQEVAVATTRTTGLCILGAGLLFYFAPCLTPWFSDRYSYDALPYAYAQKVEVVCWPILIACAVVAFWGRSTIHSTALFIGLLLAFGGLLLIKSPWAIQFVEYHGERVPSPTAIYRLGVTLRGVGLVGITAACLFLVTRSRAKELRQEL